VKKTLESAIANAENNHDLDVDDLVVSQAYVGKNLVMKRLHTRGRGKSARVLKPFANLTLVLHQKGEEAKAATPAPKKAKAKRNAAPQAPGKEESK
jgi:large subunit ribosomal protein L22